MGSSDQLERDLLFGLEADLVRNASSVPTRAILGLQVDTIMISPGAAQVTYAGAESAPSEVSVENVNAVLADALAVAESDVRLFNRPDETDAKRRLGVSLATAPDVTTARDRVRRVTGVLRKLW